jgi:Flp pilus assembly pilin Flp
MLKSVSKFCTKISQSVLKLCAKVARSLSKLCVNVAQSLSLFCLKFAMEESGADMLEYVLVLTLVALACVAGLTKLGSSISSALNTTAGTVTNSL